MTDPEPLHSQMYFSYGQFMVFDQSEKLPGCEWTDAHFAQGFARRESVASFRALDEFGDADVTASTAPYVAQQTYQRVIAVPFRVHSGVVIVEGPEEFDSGRIIRLAPGPYRLVAAQSLVGEGAEAIDLFFEPLSEPASFSEILVRDDELAPPMALIEVAAVAGEG